MKKSRKAPIRRHLLERVDNTRDINYDRVIQDLLGISREKLSKLFSSALSLLDQSRNDEAKEAFTFLTRINPYISDFWVGLGLSHLHEEQYREAFDAFSVAITMDQARPEAYIYAIDCCLEMDQITQAETLLREAVSYARRHKNDPEAQAILSQEKQVRKKIQEHKY